MARRSTHVDDTELLASTPEDPEAFAEFYRRHARALLGYLVRRLGEPELAADVCAETFAAALVGAHRYRPAMGSPASWLYGIARHKLLDAQRRGRAERHARDRLGIPILILTDEGLERVEALADVDAASVATALDELPVEQRAAVTARLVAGQSYSEIAHDQQTTEANVRQRVARGLTRLRSKMGAI
jgi:RNA polymerase sigma factor (sigma-70 family)